MKISIERFREIARTFVEVLDKEETKVLADLEKLAGQAIPIEGKPQDYLIINWRPSNQGTQALDLSYSIQHRPQKTEGGIPLNVKVNHQLKYSKVLMKTELVFPGYFPFDNDEFGNIMQLRTLNTVDWQEVRREVCRLYQQPFISEDFKII